ncbi:DUF72 domain-containing protein [Abyssalbus ytuae]|uniref:DUF72 domain-containing protein n=1 Tax=Abyssalbus ytuae TaxID=2926907 RepID=A0A9E7CU47_9FLAO|nr:DUF72 domain-containing protein [Abyssalbus ytuae]UOB17622.1 DUF72 domain-containing protein [Abyssalbus ytuae]
MKFGKVENPEIVDFTLPPDHPDTTIVLSHYKSNPLNVYVGCAKWNKQDLKNFYPRGTKDELEYYSRQFNCIELNATFYRNFPPEQYQKWYGKVPDDFKFFPKVNQTISHLKRLIDFEKLVDEYLEGIIHLKDKLGTVFLQMHNNFSPKDFNRVVKFVEYWPEEIPLAVEFRNTDWFNDKKISEELYYLLEENNVANIIVDTAGRRDLLHMRLTNDEAFIRYVGANHRTDYDRLNDWVNRIEEWKRKGLKHLHFFVHQNMEVESPFLSAYFIKNLNKIIEDQVKIPQTLNNSQTLFD